MTVVEGQSSDEQLYRSEIERVRVFNNCLIRAAFVAIKHGAFPIPSSHPFMFFGPTNCLKAGIVNILANLLFTNKRPLSNPHPWVLTRYWNPWFLIIPMTSLLGSLIRIFYWKPPEPFHGRQRYTSLGGWKCSCCLWATLNEPSFQWHHTSFTPRWVWTYFLYRPILSSFCLCYFTCVYILILVSSGPWSCRRPWWPNAPLPFLHSSANGNWSLSN